MKTVEEIIRLHGGLQAVKDNCIRIENEPYMRLVIEVIAGPQDRKDRNGVPFRGWKVSLAHYAEQNGDAMRDPEICFEVLERPDGLSWNACYYRNDYVGMEQSEERVANSPVMHASISELARIWDTNLRHQRFIDAYKKLHPQLPEAQPAQPQ